MCSEPTASPALSSPLNTESSGPVAVSREPTLNPAPLAPPEKADPRPTYLSYPLDELVRGDPRYRFRSSPTVTLDNPISPIFCTRNINSNLDPAVMHPTFQLMTNQMHTPSQMGYFFAACLGDLKDVSYGDGKGTYRAICRQSEPLSAHQVAMTKVFFAAMVPYLHFARRDMSSPDTNGTCTMTDKVIADSLNTFGVACIGYGSVICINTTLYNNLLEALEELKKDPVSTSKRDRVFASYFHIAQTLLHELVHAVSNARFGNPNGKSFPFEKSAFSEEGFDWESTVFDRIVHADGDSVYVADWPSGAVAEQYLRRRPADVGVTAPLEKLTAAEYTNAWRMPPCFVRAAFQKVFWEKVVPKLGSNAFKVPRLLGYRIAPVGLGTIYSCDCTSCFWLKEFVMRAFRRGNKTLQPAGTYAEELTKLENKRKRNKRKHDHQRKSPPPTQKDTGKQASNPSSSVPVLEKSSDHTTPSADCSRGVWVQWFGPLYEKDTRHKHSFGLPDGFKSLEDGSVVAKEHFKDVSVHRLPVKTPAVSQARQRCSAKKIAKSLEGR